ncbi:sacsin-like [Hemicordylus capensis]|uniref:sacsin-like n=1 Tax=Hemicordylus capensis TaxID=884348 RepID=UPI002302246C|nr:sacsin-like [Hemicordylus capensis]XP_053117637.1 sacsin-like [Hemicordylus capensis]XP_053117639.1 sacsin-like [Hemicordylus capensis]XP_053117640.1 sacsin-like [Hemicordylus capensis]
MSLKGKERKGFRQRSPPVLKYLQGILRKYPDGGQILKELIQNADDAGARDVVLLYDERGFGTQSLFAEGMACTQGPALLAYNDGLFTEDDWEGIQSPGLSHKEDDPSTVGRFGLGFNSVYHITDFPSILSGDWLGVLDPQRAALSEGGQLWRVDEWEEMSDQFQPFWAVLKSLGQPCPPAKGHFPGTLFRFPLRQSPSKMSENLYSLERAQELLLTFLDDAPISLLFLRSVRRLTLGLIGANGTICELLRAEATTHQLIGPDVVQGVPYSVPKAAKCCPDRGGVESILLRGLDSRDNATSTMLDVAASITTLVLRGTGIGQTTSCDWLVLSAVAQKEAFPTLWNLTASINSQPALSLAYPLQGSCTGRLCCVLPLPATEENTTGLPLHISAPFQLTDDRRHVQWSEEGSQARGADGQWNHSLMEEMLPVAYCQIMLLASGHPSDPYGAWPDPAQSQLLRYRALVVQVLKRLMDMRLLVRVGDGDPRLLYPREAVLLPEKVMGKPVGLALEKVLVLAGSLLAVAPPHVRRALALGAKVGVEVQAATTTFVRGTLRRADEHIWSKISPLEKQLLLEYMAGDRCYQELKALPLLPTASGHFARFGDSGETVFVENPDFRRILLPGLAHQFLPEDLNPGLLEHLQAMANKGLFRNLVSLDRTVIEQNLQASLPSNWVSNNSAAIVWCPKEDSKQPPLEWLAAFWMFLSRHASSLVPFKGCPLIPLTSVQNSTNGIRLARLWPQPTLLFQNSDGRCLPGEVASALEVLGCTVIRSWQSDWCHRQLREYILDPTPESILQAFAHVGVPSVASRLASLPTHQIESLSAFLSKAAALSQAGINVLRMLPLFFKMPSLHPPSTPGLVPAQQHLALEKNLVPPVPTDLLTPEPVLLCRNEDERRLLSQLRCSLLGTPDLCLLCVKAMKKGAYASRPQDARRLMLWVLHNGDSLFSQSRELQALCCDLPFLECESGALARPSHLYDPENRTLQALLRPHCFPTGPFREPAALRTLRALGLKSDLCAVSPADVLTAAREVSCLQETAATKAKLQALIQICNETPLLSRFSSQELRQLRLLAWVPATNASMHVPAGRFLAPESMRSEKYAALVGLVMGLTNAFRPQVAQALGLERSPPPEKVLENLGCLVQEYCPEGTAALTAKLHSIYQHMQWHLSDFRKPPLGPAVWNGSGFSVPADVVLAYPDGLDLALLMSRVPLDFQNYSQLFSAWGVRQFPKEEDVCQALRRLADQINARPRGGTQTELCLVVTALDWFYAHRHDGEGEMLVPVRVPGLAGFALRPANSVLYCDMDRTRLAELDGAPPILVHEAVPSETAAFLGVEMLSTRLSGLEVFEPWGPSEPVTLRIRNILREYSQDADVFQELLQNAEDAGAKTCRFLVDLRQHNGTTEGLLDPGMAACQGPALWAHNDAPFSEADFSNIIRLGAATKERQDDKIGRFGLGFCTVYHMTDVPSLLSGCTLIIFDPNLTHLQKHMRDVARPGIRLKWTRQVTTLFPEQFRIYWGIFGCQAGEDYRGTLIRLPFRSEQEAKASQICPEPFGPGRIQALQVGFQEMYSHLLLFLHNVREVSLAHLPAGSGSPEAAQPLATVTRQAVDMMGALSIVRLTATWEADVVTSHYLLHSCSGKEAAWELFKRGGKDGVHFSPPAAGVALPLCPATAAGQWVPDLDGFKGRVFCFLPLPIESGLPLHLTAAFAVLSNRKGLWAATEKGQWNTALLKDSVPQAWLGALAQLRDMYREGLLEDYDYHTFWPDVNSAKDPFTESAKAFYQKLVCGIDGEQPVLFSDGQRWCPARHACFLDADIVREERLKPTAERVFSLLLPEPQLAVPLPRWVKMSFGASTQVDTLLPNTYNWVRFFRELVLPNLAHLEVADRDALILRALDMKDASVDKILTSLPCIPTTPNKLLKNIKELAHPQGRVAPLYTSEDGRFPMGAGFLKLERLLHLEQLGMAKDWVTMEELIDRARSVVALWSLSPQKACQRAHCILELLGDHLQESSSNTAQAAFRDICFLPALLPDNERKLCCPHEIYDYKQQHLVGLIEPILDQKAFGEGFKLSREIKAFLGLSRLPPIATVLGQLEAASHGSNALTRTQLNKMTHKCYEFLNQVVQEKASYKAEVSQRAQTFPFVLVDTTFVSVCRVAHDLDFDAAPHLFQLPSEYKPYRELWRCVGLPHTFEVQDYATVLQTLAKDAGGKPLSKEKLALVIRLITVGLSEALQDQELDSYTAQSIFFPDQDQVLCPLPKLFFDDTPWLPREKRTLLCHGKIPREVAICCGIPTTKHRILTRCQIKSLSPWGVDFGAKENLSTRLANILRDYSSSSQDVLKELLQNADDAGANVIYFVWDKRQHATRRVFSEEWKTLQGPALCVYNDQVFQMQDIEGIQQLGCGGKGERRDATGKYGLGFNTVYHLTDCPAFVTGNSTLCVFDSTLQYLDESDELSPGAMYSLSKDFIDTFRDVYDAFLPEVFDLEHGTLFRLPLRTPAGAASSPICKHSVTEDDIKRMLLALKKEADCLMMFLNHVHSVVFYEISEKGGPPMEMLRVETEGGEPERLEYQKQLCQAAAAGGMDVGESVRVFYRMEIKCSFSKAPSNWLVGRQIGLEGRDTVEGMLLPHGGVAACLTSLSPGRAFCTLPLPVETGLPIHINGNFAVDSARRDLRKDDSQETRWNSLLLQCLVAPLYCHLLEELCQALGNPPLQFHTLNECQLRLDTNYLRYFPIVTENVPPLWHQLVSSVYKLACEGQCPLVPVYKNRSTYIHKLSIELCRIDVCWSAPKLDQPTREPYFLQDAISGFLESTLQNLGMHLVPAFPCLLEIRNQFVKAEIDVLTLDSPSLCYFLMNLTTLCLPCPLKQTPIKNIKNCSALLNFCLQQLNPEDTGWLDGLPLLVTQDGVLRCFSQQDPVYHSSAHDLFPLHRSRFSACHIKHLEAKELLKIGFLKDFTLHESVDYIKEMLRRNGWFSDPEGQSWLKKLWVFFEEQLKSQKKNEMDQMFAKLVSLFKGWPLLPVCGGSKSLVPLESLNMIVPDSKNDVAEILCKLGFAKIDFSLLPPKLAVCCIAPQLLKMDDPSVVLVQMAVHSSLCWQKLEKWEFSRLLRFLSSDLKKFQSDCRMLEKLKALPLFETHQGKHVPLASYQKVYILKSKIPTESKNFKELYEVEERTVLLSDNGLNNKLCECLGIGVMNDLQQFVQLLLPCLSRLPETRLLEAVKLLLLLKTHYEEEYNAQKETLTSAFQSISFIRDKQNVLRPASYFYDETEPLFQKLGLHSQFVPDKFYEMGLSNRMTVKRFLRDVGLRCEVSEAEFLGFAAQIEVEALRHGAMSNDLPDKRKALLSYLLHWKRVLSKTFFKQLSKLRFLAPKSISNDLCNLHKPYVPNNTAVAPQGNLYTWTRTELTWTSAVTLCPIITFDSENKEAVLERLGMLCTLPAELVLKNLINVCQAPCDTWKTKKIRMEVLKLIYEYLLEQESIETECLKGFPVVLIDGDEVAEAQHVVMTLKNWEEFRPYLHKLPQKLFRYLELLEKLGVEKEPNIYHYATVLARIYKETMEKNTLHPNLSKTICRAMQHFFQLLHEAKEPVDFSGMKELHLLCTDGKLYPSNTLVFCDYITDQQFGALQSKFRFLVDLSSCDLSGMQYDLQLLHRLPEGLRPKRLSDITGEQLEESSLKLCTLGGKCEFQSHFRQLLVSSEFQHAVVTLLKWREITKDMETKEATERVHAGLFSAEQLEVVCCEKVCTVMVCNLQCLEGTQHNKTVHVETMSNGKRRIYLVHQEGLGHPEGMKIMNTLAEEVNKLVGERLHSQAMNVLREILICQEPEEIVAVLKRNKVPLQRSRNLGACPLPDPGEEIPEEWHDSLDMSILHTFLVGDYVGYLDPSQPGEHYVYAVVLEVLGPQQSGAGQVHAYTIDLGNGRHVQVSAHDLYHFKQSTLTSDSSKAVVLAPSSPGADIAAGLRGGEWYQKSLSEVKKEVDASLEEIWNLSEEEKRKALRRLYLCYHPDKNLGQEDLANEIFKYLKEKIKEMENKGKPKGSSGGARSGGSSSKNFWNFSESWNEWDQQAHRHQQRRQEFTRQRESRGGGHFNYNFWSYHQPETKGSRSKEEEARRWLRQAECDLHAAANDTGNHNTEWLLYKIYRALEKALTAVEYNQGRRFDKNLSLAMLAGKVASYGSELADLYNQVAKLRKHGVDDKTTQYPRYHPSPTIPNEAFPECEEQEVLQLAQEIFDTVKKWLGQK